MPLPPNPPGSGQPPQPPTQSTQLRIADNLPVLLLPYRLETRFVPNPSPALLVRVYPSQISINAFNQQLTSTEIQAGQAYWTATWTAMSTAGADVVGPWRSLAARYGAQRAASIAAQTKPATVQTGTPLVFTLPQASTEQQLPVVAALPDQWVLFTWDTPAGVPAFTPFTNPVGQALTASPDPLSATAADPTSLATDARSAWMTDFQAAVDAGMATSVKLSAAQAQNGFARLVAVGVRVEEGLLSPHPGATGAMLLDELLNAHHYSDGVAFVAQGTATKSTPDTQAGYSSQDPGYQTSYATEQGPSLAQPPDPADPSVLSDGQITLGALGLGPGDAVFDHVYGADGIDQQDAIDMATALWPVTIGYFLRQVMALQSVTAQLARVDELREHFIAHVRGRGPLPALRVGDTPYGILPVTSLANWQAGATAAASLDWLVPYLQKALPIWQQSYAQTPRVEGSATADADLLAILGTDASSTSYQFRYVLGPQTLNETQSLIAPSAGAAWTQWQQAALTPLQQLWALLGLPAIDPASPFSNQPQGAPGFEPYSHPVCGSVVQDAPVSETKPVQGNYIDLLLRQNHATLHATQAKPTAQQGPLLERLLRASLLEEYAASTQDYLAAHGGGASATLVEPELVDMAGQATDTLWTLLQTPVSALGNKSPGAYIDALKSNKAQLSTEFPRLAELLASIERLATRPSAKLERAMSEVLDTCSHRLDAWVTAMAAALMPGPQSTSGLSIGAYSWVEGLKPDAPAQAAALTATEQQAVAALDAQRSAAAAAPGTVEPPHLDNGGFIHAPSAAQGAAGAILRNGFLTHQQSTEGTLLAIDLSSQRVNTALSYLDGVREGQSLGALLGYTFEQALTQAGLGPIVADFRNAYPLVANKLNPTPSGTPTSAVAAANVVDGLALQRAWAQPEWTSPATSVIKPGQPDTINEALLAINEALLAITDVLDAIGDLSLSESVYQIVRGNPTRAGGLLNAISQGERPPEVQVVQTPHGGRSFTHRLLAMFCGQQPPQPPPWATGSGNPRAVAEPWLDSWLRAVLPDPAAVTCWVQYGPDGGTQTVEISLDTIDAGPLDLLAMAGSADQGQLSELEQRVLYQAYSLEKLPAGAQSPQVLFSGTLDRSAAIAVPDLLVLLRAVRDLLAGARALRAADLSTPDQPDTTPPDAADLSKRATAASNAAAGAAAAVTAGAVALQNAITTPGGNTAALAAQLATALLSASWFGVRGSVPAPIAAGNSPSAMTAAFDASTSTWTIGFTTSASGKLDTGATVTLLAPPGAALPGAATAYTIAGQSLTPGQAHVRQSTVVLELPAGATVDAGAAAQVTVTVAAAPPAGSCTWAVSTSADPLFAISTPCAIAGAGTSVTAVTVALDNQAPGASATYTLAFTTSGTGAISGSSKPSGTITLALAPDTTLSARAGDYLINGVAPASVQLAASKATLTLAASATIAAQAGVTVTAARVTNPQAGTYAAAVATSADEQTSDGTAGYAIGPLPLLLAQAGQVAAALTGNAQTASGVTVTALTVAGRTFTLEFAPSATGALVAGSGTIAMLGPPGLTFSANAADYTVSVTGSTGVSAPAAVTLAPQVTPGSVRLTVPIAVGAGETVTVTGKLTAPPPGGYSLSVLTSANAIATASPAFSVPGGSGTSPAGVTATVDPTATTYTIDFTTSASGVLNAQQDATITLLAAAQTQFSSSAGDYTVNGAPLTATPLSASGQVTLPVPASIAAGTAVTVKAANVTGPGAGSYTISVMTSADTLAAPSAAVQIPASANDSLAQLETVFGRSFIVLPQFVPADGAALQAAFADSAQLIASDPVSPARWLQQLTHVRDAVSRTDLVLSLGQILGGAAPASAGASASSSEPQWTVEWTVAQLPQLPGDTWLALPQPSSLSGASVSISANAAGSAATYTITFSTSATGALAAGESITVTAPAGTTLPSAAAAYSLQTASGHTATVATATPSGWPVGLAPANQVVLTLGASAIAADDIVTVTIAGAANPPHPGDYSIVLSSSVDPQPTQTALYVIAGADPGPPGAPPASRVSLVALTGVAPAGTPAGGEPVRGLLLDEWPEQIPNSVESTSLVFHYEEPTARAPHALLLAFNPTNGFWTYGMLATILAETLDLAKVRTVDLSTLADGEQLIPAMYIPYNLAAATITTTLGCFEKKPVTR